VTCSRHALPPDPLERVLNEAWLAENRAYVLHQQTQSEPTWAWLMYLRERRIEIEAQMKARRRAEAARRA
jgi:hypothetical protein